jgi:hypothetical protein
MAAAAYDDAAEKLRTALALGIADAGERARAQIDLGYLLAETGHVSDAEAPVADAIGECRELLEAASRDRALAAVISRFLALLLAMRGDREEALARLAQSDVVLDALGLITNSGVYGWAGFETRRLLGDLAGAERQQRATWQLFCGSGSRGIDERAMGAAYRLGWFLCDLGRWDEGSELAAFASDVPEPPQPTLTALYRLGLAGRLAARHGDIVRAIELGQRVVATAEVRGNPNFKGLARGGLAEIFRKAGGRRRPTSRSGRRSRTTGRRETSLHGRCRRSRRRSRQRDREGHGHRQGGDLHRLLPPSPPPTGAKRAPVNADWGVS